MAIQPPAVDKVSLFRIAGGEIERLFELFEQARRRAGQPIEICACYDGFWIYRALTARGVACTVLDSASIQVSRRARRVKTDRTDAESLVRVLMAIYRGEHQVAKIVQVPSPEEEDDKRLLRCRGNLLRDRIQHMNRIRGLLNLQGVRHIDPNGAVTLPCEERERSTPYGSLSRRDGLTPRGHRRGAQQAVCLG